MHWIIFIFCTVIGFVSLYYGIKLLRLYRTVVRWARSKATVLKKTVIPKRLSSGSRASHTVLIEYQYTYNGQPYTNNKIFLVEFLNGEKGFSKKAAEKFLERLEEKINIHVDPNNPNRSVIFCDGLLLYLFMIATGFIMILSGLVSFF
jgi:hypothetical protein